MLVLLPSRFRPPSLVYFIIGLLIFRGTWHHVFVKGPDLIPFPAVADALALGCLLAIIFPQFKAFLARWPRPMLYCAESGLVVFIWVEQVSFNRGWLRPGEIFLISLAHNLAVVFFVGLVVAQPQLFVSRILNWPWLAWIGVLSYSIYIWQQLFTGPPMQGLPAFWWQEFPGNLGAMLMISILSYYVIEKPFLGLKKLLPLRSPQAVST